MLFKSKEGSPYSHLFLSLCVDFLFYGCFHLQVLNSIWFGSRVKVVSENACFKNLSCFYSLLPFTFYFHHVFSYGKREYEMLTGFQPYCDVCKNWFRNVLFFPLCVNTNWRFDANKQINLLNVGREGRCQLTRTWKLGGGGRRSKLYGWTQTKNEMSYLVNNMKDKSESGKRRKMSNLDVGLLV